MAIRSITSVSLTFGLVSIPVKVYLATESSAAPTFKLMAAGGARVRQQYFADADPVHELLAEESEEPVDNAPEDMPAPTERVAVIAAFPTSHLRTVSCPAPRDMDDEPRVAERAEMVKGYEFEKGQFVFFTFAETQGAGSPMSECIIPIATSRFASRKPDCLSDKGAMHTTHSRHAVALCSTKNERPGQRDVPVRAKIASNTPSVKRRCADDERDAHAALRWQC